MPTRVHVTFAGRAHLLYVAERVHTRMVGVSHPGRHPQKLQQHNLSEAVTSSCHFNANFGVLMHIVIVPSFTGNARRRS